MTARRQFHLADQPVGGSFHSFGRSASVPVCPDLRASDCLQSKGPDHPASLGIFRRLRVRQSSAGTSSPILLSNRRNLVSHAVHGGVLVDQFLAKLDLRLGVLYAAFQYVFTRWNWKEYRFLSTQGRKL